MTVVMVGEKASDLILGDMAETNAVLQSITVSVSPLPRI